MTLHFSKFVLMAYLLTSCGPTASETSVVSNSTYNSPECLIEDGILDAFVVFTEQNGQLVPATLPIKCILKANNADDLAVDTLVNVGSTKLLPFPQKLLGKNIIGNFHSEIPTPAGDAVVYLLRAEATSERIKGRTFVRVRRVLCLLPTKTTFASLLRLPASEREILADSIHSCGKNSGGSALGRKPQS